VGQLRATQLLFCYWQQSLSKTSVAGRIEMAILMKKQICVIRTKTDDQA